MTYPVPHYAATFWIAGDNLMIAFPGQGPEGRGHTITLPCSVAGFSTAITIMKDREHARSLRLGVQGTPTQYEVENDQRYKALVRARKEEREAAREEREEAEAFLKELGL